MATNIDVLAAWDRQIEWLRDLVATNPGSECHTEELEEAVEARAAVAELVAAAQALSDSVSFRIDDLRCALHCKLADALVACRGDA